MVHLDKMHSDYSHTEDDLRGSIVGTKVLISLAQLRREMSNVFAGCNVGLPAEESCFEHLP
jgi:hypothetical protein